VLTSRGQAINPKEAVDLSASLADASAAAVVAHLPAAEPRYALLRTAAATIGAGADGTSGICG
jgi:hypothetical protein